MITKKEAQAIIDAMIKLRDSATNEQAKDVSILYPKWEENKDYEAGIRIVYENNLYHINKTHTSSLMNLPNDSTLLYTLISE